MLIIMKNIKILIPLLAVVVTGLAINTSTVESTEAQGSQICEFFYPNWEQAGLEPCLPPYPIDCYCEIVVRE